jgi:hypothetical protein
MVGGFRSNVGRSIGVAAQGVANLGAAFDREDKFNAERKFAEFAYEQEQSYSETLKNAQPGAAGLRDGVVGGYQDSAKKFLKNIPDHLKGEYDGKLLDYETRLSRSSDAFETKERERFSIEGVTDAHNKLALLVEADPTKYKEAAESSRVLLETVPTDNITRETLRKKFSGVVAKAGVEGILKAGGTEADVRAFIQGQGPAKSVPQSGIQGQIANNVSNAPYALAVAERESSFKHDAKASKTIRGLFQMDAATRAKYGITENATPEEQAKAFDRMTADRANELSSIIGRKPSLKETYLAHHFGVQGAAELLNADPDESTKDWVFRTFGNKARAVWDQNKHIRDAKTVGNLIQSTSADIEKRVAKYGGDANAEYGAGASAGVDSDIEAFAEVRIRAYRKNFQQAYMKKAEDYEAYLRSGNTPTGAFSTDELAANLDAGTAIKMRERLDNAQSFGKDVASVKFAAPEEIDLLVKKARKSLESPDDFERKAKEYNQLAQVIEQRNKALLDDSAKYVLQNPAVADSYAKAFDPSTPQEQRGAAMDQYVSDVLAEQKRLGLPIDVQRVLPKQVAQDIARQFNQQANGSQGAVAAMNQLQSQWGKHFPRVMGEIGKDIPARARVVASMNRPEQRVSAERLAELAVRGEKAIDESLNTTQKRDIGDAVRTASAPLLATLQGVPGGTAEFKTYRSSVELLAKDYVLGGMSASGAATKAFNDIVGSKYEFIGTMRVPVEVGVSTVRRGASTALANIGNFDLKIPEALAPGLDKKAIKESYIASLQSFGQWYAAPDESGLILYGPDRRAVTLSNGDLLLIPWDNLPDIAKGGRGYGAASQWTAQP